ISAMEEEQEKILEEAKRNSKEQAYYMHQAIDSAKLKDSLKNAASMIAELKNEKLSPKNYYVLFMAIFDELRELENAFMEEVKRGRRAADLYESVQHAAALI